MSSSAFFKKTSISLVAYCLYLLIWYIFLVIGLRGAWALHHKTMWRDYNQGLAKEFTFALATTPKGEVIAIPFSELQKQIPSMQLSFAPPIHLSGRTEALKLLVDSFNRSHEFHWGEPTSAKLSLKNNQQSDVLCEIEVHFYGGGQLIWRYSANKTSAQPLQWYEIHDTAGLVLLPMAFGIWLFISPIAIWLTRLVSRTRKRLLHIPTAP